MKKILLIALLFISVTFTFGQIDVDKFTFTSFGDAEKRPIAIIAAPPDNNIYTIGLERQDAYSSGRDTAFEAQHGRGSYILERLDSSAVHLFVHGITKTNTKDYEFRVFENKNKELVAWQTIGKFIVDSVKIRDFEKGMGYLGSYKTTWNNYVVVEIRKKGTTKIVESMIMYWRQIRPVLLNIYTNKELQHFLAKAQQSFPLKLSDDEKSKWLAEYAPSDIDTSTFLPKKLLLSPSNE